MFRDIPTFSHTCISSLLTFSLSDLLSSDVLPVWASSFLCVSICPYCRKFGSLTSQLPSNICLSYNPIVSSRLEQTGTERGWEEQGREEQRKLRKMRDWSREKESRLVTSKEWGKDEKRQAEQRWVQNRSDELSLSKNQNLFFNVFNSIVWGYSKSRRMVSISHLHCYPGSPGIPSLSNLRILLASFVFRFSRSIFWGGGLADCFHWLPHHLWFSGEVSHKNRVWKIAVAATGRCCVAFTNKPHPVFLETLQRSAQMLHPPRIVRTQSPKGYKLHVMLLLFGSLRLRAERLKL